MIKQLLQQTIAVKISKFENVDSEIGELDDLQKIAETVYEEDAEEKNVYRLLMRMIRMKLMKNLNINAKWRKG